MVLLRKKDHPEEIKDFRPISLIHSFGKLLTKCLANRLASTLDQLVLKNQGRSIHDNFREVQLACQEIHKRRMPCILLKVDIAKAFDSVAWNFLLELLQHIGFGIRWTNWISAILASSSTKILLNGRSGKRICHARGLRQGDPLSPMLFVLVMEVLDHLLRWVQSRGLLAPVEGVTGHRVSLYADDLVLFVKPDASSMLAVKEALNIFGRALGLFANLDKSLATPLHCDQHEMDLVLNTLECRTQAFPCRYLGVPLSVFKLKRGDEQPLIDKIASRIPGWKGQLLNMARRTALVKATLSAIPIHTSIALCLSPWALGAIDKLRRAFLWAGNDSVSAGKCKVAWITVCLPKELGGLGISDLKCTGIALRTRWLWRDRLAGMAPRTSERAVLSLF